MHQTGIFSEQGMHAHFLEYKLSSLSDRSKLIQALKSLYQSKQSVSSVIGFGADVSKNLFQDSCPNDLINFEKLSHLGCSMEALQGDLFLYLHSDDKGRVFQCARNLHQQLTDIAHLTQEVQGFRYLDSRDLTGFVDGSANPKDEKALQAALIPEGLPGEHGSYMLTQKWVHQLSEFDRLNVKEQENVIGRTKEDSIELSEEVMPKDSHVSRTDLKVDGVPYKIYRRSMPFGNLQEHGLYFLAFSCESKRLTAMLDSMLGIPDGVQDRILNYSKAISSAYWFCPNQALLDSLLA